MFKGKYTKNYEGVKKNFQKNVSDSISSIFEKYNNLCQLHVKFRFIYSLLLILFVGLRATS